MVRWLGLGLVLLVGSGCAIHVQDHPWLLCRRVIDAPYMLCKPIPAPKEVPPDPASGKPRKLDVDRVAWAS